MILRIYKEYRRSDVPTNVKQRVKHGKGKVTSKANETMFAHWELPEHSNLNFRYQISKNEEERQLAKLDQIKNTFGVRRNGLVFKPKDSILQVERGKIALIKWYKSKGFKIINVSSTHVGVILHGEVTEVQGRRSAALYSKGLGYIDMELNEDTRLQEVLYSAMQVAGKFPEKGNYVLNVKLSVINTGGEALERSKIGVVMNYHSVNIHEVTVNNFEVPSWGGAPIPRFSKETMKRYADLLPMARRAVEFSNKAKFNRAQAEYIEELPSLL